MKTPIKKPNVPRNYPKGFALIITLTLMVLMTILAIGLFSLSTVTVRTASQGKAQETAKANARMALMIALGELQKTAGPDQRITATGSIMNGADASVNHVTGVWNSWKIDPNQLPTAADYTQGGAKKGQNITPTANTNGTGGFIKWLVSHQNPASPLAANFVISPQFGEKVSLVPSLSSTVPALDAGVVPVLASSGTRTGGYAWTVLDEGTKARINLGYTPPAGELGNLSLSIGSGVRADIGKVTGLQSFTPAKADFSVASNQQLISRAITLSEAELLLNQFQQNSGQVVSQLTHDLTTDSLGLMTNVSNGGFKEDFNSMMQQTSLPTPYAGNGIYQSLFGLNEPQVDPKWNSLYAYTNIYKKLAVLRKVSGGTAPVLTAQTPAGWTTTTIPTSPPAQTITPLLPSMCKVQILYSLVSIEGGIAAPPGGGQTLYIMYTPVITLHNPYNVQIVASNLRVEFSNIPIAVKIYKNGVSGALDFVPTQKMYAGASSKKFGFTLKENVAGAPSGTSINLLPGEIKMFTPYIPADRSYDDDVNHVNNTRYFLDTMTNTTDTNRYLDTTNEVAIPGNRNLIGYLVDYLNADGYRPPSPPAPQPGSSSFFSSDTKGNDELFLEFAPLGFGGSSVFSVQLKDDSVANGNIFSAMNFDFSGDKSSASGAPAAERELQTVMLGKNKILRYPKSGSLLFKDIYQAKGDKIKNWNNYRPFAIISATAKTTYGGLDPVGQNYEGRYPSKPWAFNSDVGIFSTQRISSDNQNTEHPAQHAYDLDLTPLDESAGYGKTEFFDSNASGRAYFISGHTAYHGRKLGTLYEIPLAPLQTLPSLNGANLAGSGFLPRFTAPVGNSWAHPILPTSSVRVSAISGAGSTATGITPVTYNQLDHSFFLNSALYDRFYFSGLARHQGTFMTALDNTVMASQFIQGTRALTDPRFIPWLPDQSTSASATDSLNAVTAYTQAGAYQMLKGAFNINSTSVEAWKAMLSSVHTQSAKKNLMTATSTTSALSPLNSLGNTSARFNRFRLPNEDSVESSADPNDAYWLGGRDLTASQLQTLATNIVAEVKRRGPFLSLAEFVNRQVGVESALTLKGALQSAIDASSINSTSTGSGYDIQSAAILPAYKLKSVGAATGASDQGAPGYLTQADLMVALGNAATARSDTFKIRSYGDARDSSGSIIARAWCEATVQRVPDFIDPADRATTAIPQLTSTQNQLFGRKFIITSFKWLKL